MHTAEPRRLSFSAVEWDEREQALRALMNPCRLCPRRCGVARQLGERGRCRVGDRVLLARACLHRGEEPVLSGSRGAGTLFFAGCTLRCVYCQNHQISQAIEARRRPRPDAVELVPSLAGRRQIARWELEVGALAETFLSLATAGAHNIEWVSPTPHLPFLVSALRQATARGLTLPVVFNSSGYEAVEALRPLDGLVDVYLPDLKYTEGRVSGRLSAAPDYPRHALAALREMQRQVGVFTVDDEGLVVKGLLVRHLVLPGRWDQTEAVLRVLTEELDPGVAVSLMAQYHPEHLAAAVADLDRPLSQGEYAAALAALERSGIIDGFVQELDSARRYRPDFDREDHPFEGGPAAARVTSS